MIGLALAPDEREAVARLVAKHLPSTRLLAYGSRVTGGAQDVSDLDLVAFSGPDQRDSVAALREDFEEGNLPFAVDLHVWQDLPESFQRQILSGVVEIQAEGGNGPRPLDQKR